MSLVETMEATPEQRQQWAEQLADLQPAREESGRVIEEIGRIREEIADGAGQPGHRQRLVDLQFQLADANRREMVGRMARQKLMDSMPEKIQAALEKLRGKISIASERVTEFQREIRMRESYAADYREKIEKYESQRHPYLPTWRERLARWESELPRLQSQLEKAQGVLDKLRQQQDGLFQDALKP